MLQTHDQVSTRTCPSCWQPVCHGKAAAIREARQLAGFRRASRVLEDYAVLYFGPALFKIARLLLVAMMCVRARLAYIDVPTRRYHVADFPRIEP